jgi:hypothetical protein
MNSGEAPANQRGLEWAKYTGRAALMAGRPDLIFCGIGREGTPKPARDQAAASAASLTPTNGASTRYVASLVAPNRSGVRSCAA